MTPTHPAAPAKTAYPAAFLWGVSTSAYQVEGYLNGPGQPRNNWADWEARGRAAPTGRGCAFWERWPDDLDRAARLGVNAFRLGVEWARVQPAAGGAFDDDALNVYAALVAGARRRGLRPVVTLQHFTHPEWLGRDPWLDPSVPAIFGRYVGDLVRALGRRLAARHGQPPIDFYVTVNEPNALALATYLAGVFPRGRAALGPRSLARALCRLLQAHVAAYRAVHQAHDELGAAPPTVTLNTWACSAYAGDRGLIDLLRPVSRGRWNECRRRWRAALPWRRLVDEVAERVLGRALRPAAFAELLRQLGPDEDPLDVLAIDFYDPFLSDYVGLKGLRRHPWQWPTRTDRLFPFLRAYLDGHPDRDLYLLENGIGVRRPINGNPAAGRPDGLSRDRALGQAVAAVDRCLRADLRLAGYFHWSLLDNYEWGSFEPRFGLYGVDYQDDARRLATDVAGVDAAGCYRRLIAERRGPAS